MEFDPTEAVKKYQASVENTLTKGLQSDARYTAAKRSWILDMSFELGENQLSTLGLIVGFNKSDSTYGWNGYLGGMKRFKIHKSLS